MALNVVLPAGFSVNIFDSHSRLIFGSEHNNDGDIVLLVHFGSGHYTALEKVNP